MKSRNRFDLFLHAVFYSLITAAAAQFHINIFSPEFSVSLGIVFLASFSMLAQDFPVIPVSAISGIFVLLSRTFYGSFNGTSLGDAFVSSIPELFFLPVLRSAPDALPRQDAEVLHPVGHDRPAFLRLCGELWRTDASS